jgi:hypothetical protein
MSLAFALMAAINGSTGSSATIVPTGILPLRATAHGGSAVDVAPGQVGVVHLAHVGHHGVFQIATTIHLTGWWWLTLLAWTVPMLLALRYRRNGDDGIPIPV